MRSRQLSVTARTTLDLVEASVEGPDLREEGVAVVDVQSPEDSEAVSLQVELDPADCDTLPHHADRVSLSPGEARRLAADLDSAAAAAEAGETMTSGRSR